VDMEPAAAEINLIPTEVYLIGVVVRFLFC